MPKPVHKPTWLNRLIDADFGKGAPEGSLLPMMLDAAVPLWQHHYKDCTPGERQDVLKEIESEDFCLRMEYLLHRGPKEGDSAKAFNDLAKSIAILSFYSGGVNVMGRHWEFGRLKLA